MGGLLAIAAYRSLVGGSPSGGVDIQVRWIDSTNADEVRARLIAEPFMRYSNPAEEQVCWELVEVLAIEPFEPKESGEEVIGFIASAEELRRLA